MDIHDFVPWLMDRAKWQARFNSDRELARNIRSSSAAMTGWRHYGRVPDADFLMKMAAYADFPPDKALLIGDMLRSGGKSAAIYRGILEDRGGFAPFPFDSQAAA